MVSLSYLYQGYIVPASTLIPIIGGVVFHKRLNKSLRILMIYLVFSLVINVIGSIMAAYSKNNLPLLHFYTIFELLMVLLYYKQAFSTKQTDYWISIIMVGFPILCVINFSFFQSIYQYNTYTRPLEAIIIIIFSGIYLAKHTGFEKQDTLDHSGIWIAGGFLIYFCSSLFDFVFSNVVSHYSSHSVKMVIWNLNATFVLIMYLVFYMGIHNESAKR